MSRSPEKDLVMLILLVAVMFAAISFVKNAGFTGLVVEEEANLPPVWGAHVSEFQIPSGSFLALDLGMYFIDPDGDELTFLAAAASDLNVELQQSIVRITPSPGFSGERLIPLFASDFDKTTRHVITVVVSENAMAPSTPIATPSIITDQASRKVGEKLYDDPAFNTIIESAFKTPTDFIVKFYHDSQFPQPVWVEGDVEYTLTASNAAPGEKITLAVRLVEGIIPKFKLHVGQTSDVFEFGKTIPEVIADDGSYDLIDSGDGLDVHVDFAGASVLIQQVDSELIEARAGNALDNELINSGVFAAGPVVMDSAIITLSKSGAVRGIVECSNFDLDSFTCLGGWHDAGIPFVDNGNTVTFTVNHFSAYASIQALFACTWRLGNCTGNESKVMEASDTSNAHAARPVSAYNYSICCEDTTGRNTIDPSQPPVFLELSNVSNAHVAQPGFSNYTYNVSMNGNIDNLSCSYSYTSGVCLNATDGCVATISDTNNAHVGDCSAYNLTVCCGFPPVYVDSNVTINKIAQPNPVYIGGNLTYYINVTNNGPGLARDVVVGEDYPPEVVFVSATPSPDVPNSTWNLGNMTSGQSVLIEIIVNVLSNTTNNTGMLNTANVTWTNDTDVNRTENSSQIVTAVLPPPPNVSINKSDTPDPVYNGQIITYSLAYFNHGPGNASYIEVFETYPPEVIFVSSNPPPDVMTNNKWTVSNVLAGTGGSIIVRVKANVPQANLPVNITNNVNLTGYDAVGFAISPVYDTENTTVRKMPVSSGGGGGWPATDGYRRVQQAETSAAQTTAGCFEAWTCTEWSDCSGGIRTRACTDINNCSTEFRKPAEEVPCALVPEMPAAAPEQVPVYEPPELPPQPPLEMAAPVAPAPGLLEAGLPIMTYAVLLLLVAALIIYMVRKHMAGKDASKAWAYLAYSLLGLAVILAAMEYILFSSANYPAAITVVVILCALLLDFLLSLKARPEGF